MGELNEPWGLAVAPDGNAARRELRERTDQLSTFGMGRAWSFTGQLHGRDGKPIVISGLWGIAFGNGAMAGPKDTLFFAAGPHRWRGASELGVHGLLGSISR